MNTMINGSKTDLRTIVHAVHRHMKQQQRRWYISHTHFLPITCQHEYAKLLHVSCTRLVHRFVSHPARSQNSQTWDQTCYSARKSEWEQLRTELWYAIMRDGILEHGSGHFVEL